MFVPRTMQNRIFSVLLNPRGIYHRNGRHRETGAAEGSPRSLSDNSQISYGHKFCIRLELSSTPYAFIRTKHIASLAFPEHKRPTKFLCVTSQLSLSSDGSRVAVLGEKGKFVPISRQRITHIEHKGDNLLIDISGSANEVGKMSDNSVNCRSKYTKLFSGCTIWICD